jgi:excisionase family DNA binding protein
MEKDREREQEQPVLLKAEQVCRIVNLGRSKVYELIASQQIPSISIGRSRRVLRADLMAWIEKQRTREGGGDRGGGDRGVGDRGVGAGGGK